MTTLTAPAPAKDEARDETHAASQTDVCQPRALCHAPQGHASQAGEKPATFIELERFEIDIPAMMRGLVHELRNPLAAILTASTLLESVLVPAPAHDEIGGVFPPRSLDDARAFDEESAMLLGVVAKEARRMNAILTEFSHFVKPPTPHIEIFDIANTARAEIAALQREFPDQWEGVTVLDELPETLEARGDVHLVSVALRQILSNARDAVGSGGQIRVSGLCKDAQIAVCIDDNGSGLSSEAQQRAFQPFYSQKPSATGLGLSLARMLVRASGGEISLENREASHGGAHATLSLPAS